ncbi:hypothetical protein AMAG_12926 [Allomyces macrogynus ATCC 38327]|uniref:Cleavage and polyadenylation specificity factor subunit 2 n=1 Tax=Allomyces macrogynus (strain ATCC 38327) TaxID=578462 RepID=A0A0L0T0H3_ALLM3|nr:hypothetical protein AMAG_12926 [Allomyces macrogynus ATCC 38327]|eukprot:KNE68252.1 hypothetical protein AMAG_12926 [Allomyces macrogynus ATCC 38327]
MTSVIPLSGARDARQGAMTLLQLDEAKILLDCGWTPDVNPDDLTLLKKHARDIDCVLLTHGSLRHCGALPYAIAKLGLNCPIYATFPVQTMGRHTVHDALLTKKMHEPVDHLFSRRDVELAFNRVTLLRYSQPYPLSGKAQGTTITAFAAGHSVGGTVWSLKRATEDIVYVMDMNHRKDAHLAPTTVFHGDQIAPPLMRPTLLIASAHLPVGHSIRGRDDALLHPALETLKAGGNVLIPVDAASRVLELAYVLEDRWTKHSIPYPVVLLSHVAHKVMHSARGMLEWYAESLTHAFSNRRVSPFDFQAVKVAASWDELKKHPDPKLVLATDDALTSGFARDLFLDMAASPRNLVVLPSAGTPGSLVRALYDQVRAASTSGTGSELAVLHATIPLSLARRVPLEGDELAAYVADKAAAAERAREEADLLAKNKSIIEAELSDDEDDNDEGVMGETAIAAAAAPEASKSQHRTHATFVGFDAYVRDNPRARFPFVEHRRRFDEYGEVIKPEHYMTDADRMEKERERAARRRQEAEEARLDQEEAMDVDDDKDDAPMKYVKDDVSLDVHCRVQVIDYEGLSDLTALARIVPMMQARTTVLVGGDDGETGALFDELAKAAGAVDLDDAAEATPQLLAPKVGDVVRLSAAAQVTQVKLTDALFTQLTLHKYGEYEIGTVSAMVCAPAGTAAEGTTAAGAGVPALDVVELAAMQRPPPVVIGTLRLSDFKTVLDREGFSTEFNHGVLVVNGKVGVGKNGAGELVLEGRICPEYYRVRKLLYQQHVVL